MRDLAAALVTGFALLATAVLVARRRTRAPRLPAPEDRAEPTTVLVPMRDEEEHVEACLDGLLGQTARPEIRVVDDGSRDRTAARVAARAAGEPRLRLLAAGELPAGWRGKVHALDVGFRGIGTPWVLLTDADVRHHPEVLARALAAAARWRLDAISLAGHQVARGVGENLLVPAVFAVLDALAGDWRQAADGSGPAVANGQFLLLRREAWERTGGFASIRGAAIDDVAVVTRLRQAGFRTGFVRAPRGLAIRMYRGLGQAIRGWRRNLGGLFGRRPALSAALVAALAGPPLLLVTLVAAGRPGPAVLLWVSGAAASALLRRGSDHAPAYGLLYPADSLLLAAVLALGAGDYRRGRLVSWKGREMRLGV